MAEEPKATPSTTEELVVACRAAHLSVCDALNTLVTQDEYDTDSDIAQSVRCLTAALGGLSRYIQANASDRAAPIRETEPNPEPVGQVPAEPERT